MPTHPIDPTSLPDTAATRALAARLFPQVFRTTLDPPGFALLCPGPHIASHELRRWMVMLKEALAALYHETTGRHLVYLSMGRFDQQVSTKFHLDGAPDESFLMLGYEPSEVTSELWVADFTRAAHQLGITPTQFLADYNPMFARGEAPLRPHATRLDDFDPRNAHVLLLNNSRLPFHKGGGNFLGVMHRAIIPEPRPDRQRIVNSTMLGSAASREEEPVSKERQALFMRTAEVSGEIAR